MFTEDNNKLFVSSVSCIYRLNVNEFVITAKMSTTITLYGDRYVKNLRNYCNGDLRVPATVFWFDKGGLRADFKKRDGKRIDTDAKAKYDQMIELRPDVAFINVSGNDITTETKPREIFIKSPIPDIITALKE